MNERQRDRMGLGLIVGIPILGMVVLGVALATQSRLGVMVALALPAVFAVCVLPLAIRARRRSGPIVPPELQGLDPQDRRIVAAALSGGGRVADPELARAVVAQARRQQRVTALFIVSSASGVVLRSGRWRRTTTVAGRAWTSWSSRSGWSWRRPWGCPSSGPGGPSPATART